MADNAARMEKIIEVRLDANKAIEGITRLNQQIDDNKVKLKELANESGKNTREYTQLAEKTKALAGEKRLLQREVQNEIKQESELDGSLRGLRAELSNLTQQYDKLSRAERENINVGGKLKKQINDVTTEIKRAEEGTQRYYRNVGNYRNSILEAVGMNSRFGGSLVSIVNTQGGVSGAFSAMGSSVKAFGAALWSLMANPVFLALAGIVGAGMAFKWFYDYNEGIAEANRLTKEFTGLTGDAAVSLRNGIMATSEVMDKEFLDTLKTVDTLMANYHITGEEALDIINKGFAAGADLNGDMLSKLQQMAPLFHDAGIAADEMMAIITQTRSGIFTDQGLEAIKQGSARIREMSSTTRAALRGIGIDADAMEAKLRDGTLSTFGAVKQVSAALKEMPDNAQEVGQVMQAVFGRQGKFASQEMIESLAEMSTSLDEVTAKTGRHGELLLENIDTEKELNDVTSALFDMTNKGWEEAKQSAEIYGKKLLVDVVKSLIDMTNWFVRLYNRTLPLRASIQAMITQWRVLWQVIKYAFNLLVDGFKTAGRLIDAFVNAFQQAGKAIGKFGEGVATIFSGIANRSVDEIRRGIDTITRGIAGGAGSALAGFRSAFEGSIEETLGDVKSLATGMADVFSDALENTLNGRLNEINIPAALAGGSVTDTTTNNDNTNTNTNNGGSGGAGGGGRGGSSAGKAEANKELEELTKRANALISKANELQRKALEESAKTSEEGINKLADLQIKTLQDTYGEISQYDEQAQAAYNALLDDIETKRQKAIVELREKESKAAKQQTKQALDDAQKLAQTLLDGTKEGDKAAYDYRRQLLALQQQAELADLDANERLKAENYEMWQQMHTAIAEKYAKQRTDLEREEAERQMEIEATRLQSYQQMAGALSGIAEAIGEDNKAAAAASKVLAVGEVMLAQAVAIANAVKAGSNAVTPWQMIAQIATSITAVTSAMVQAFRSLDQAKFATGGYIRGAGTSTSDSIPVRVSNGESIMNANTTAMFGALLSSLNQLGGGVPIQVQQTATSVQGEDMLARAVARGVAMLPAPVVSVEDINRGQRQVEVLNTRATI